MQRILWGSIPVTNGNLDFSSQAANEGCQSEDSRSSLQIGLGRRVALLVISGWETLLLLSSAAGLSQHQPLPLGGRGWLQSSCAAGLCREFVFPQDSEQSDHSRDFLQRFGLETRPNHVDTWTLHMSRRAWPLRLPPGQDGRLFPNLGLPHRVFQRKRQPGGPAMASTYYMLETPKTLETPQRHLFTSQEEFRGPSTSSMW